MIRKATTDDASRIAEISIFTKRLNYRTIFQNDKVSFGEMQVYPLAKTYIDHPEKLEGIWVYDDGFVKGFIHIVGQEIRELYVDGFFSNKGIGSQLLAFAVREHACTTVWVLEKNTKARRFYRKHGFVATGRSKLEEGTDQYIMELSL
ncbi:MAG: GNAT family N-acetyltransferase [Clostridiales bacterium]|nr:GNAT family N-acetyltransferase [Clostridiales bacterium]